MHHGQKLREIVSTCPTQRGGVVAELEKFKDFVWFEASNLSADQASEAVVVGRNRKGPVFEHELVSIQEPCGSHGGFQRRETFVNPLGLIYAEEFPA